MEWLVYKNFLVINVYDIVVMKMMKLKDRKCLFE